MESRGQGIRKPARKRGVFWRVGSRLDGLQEYPEGEDADTGDSRGQRLNTGQKQGHIRADGGDDKGDSCLHLYLQIG